MHLLDILCSALFSKNLTWLFAHPNVGRVDAESVRYTKKLHSIVPTIYIFEEKVRKIMNTSVNTIFSIYKVLT